MTGCSIRSVEAQVFFEDARDEGHFEVVTQHVLEGVEALSDRTSFREIDPDDVYYPEDENEDDEALDEG